MIWKKLKELFGISPKLDSIPGISQKPKQPGVPLKFASSHYHVLIVQAKNWNDPAAVERELSRSNMTFSYDTLVTDDADDVECHVRTSPKRYRHVLVFDTNRNSNLLVDLIMHGIPFKHFQR